MKCECDNCEWTGDEAELKRGLLDVQNLNERLDIGSEVPAGECPKCEALAYLVGPPQPKPLRLPRVVSEMETHTIIPAEGPIGKEPLPLTSRCGARCPGIWIQGNGLHKYKSVGAYFSYRNDMLKICIQNSDGAMRDPVVEIRYKNDGGVCEITVADDHMARVKIMEDTRSQWQKEFTDDSGVQKIDWTDPIGFKPSKAEVIAGIGEDVAAGRLTIKEGHALATKIEQSPYPEGIAELLAACESVCADWDASEEVLFESVRKARAAIAKAKGK